MMAAEARADSSCNEAQSKVEANPPRADFLPSQAERNYERACSKKSRPASEESDHPLAQLQPHEANLDAKKIREAPYSGSKSKDETLLKEITSQGSAIVQGRFEERPARRWRGVEAIQPGSSAQNDLDLGSVEPGPSMRSRGPNVSAALGPSKVPKSNIFEENCRYQFGYHHDVASTNKDHEQSATAFNAPNETLVTFAERPELTGPVDVNNISTSESVSRIPKDEAVFGRGLGRTDNRFDRQNLHLFDESATDVEKDSRKPSLEKDAPCEDVHVPYQMRVLDGNSMSLPASHKIDSTTTAQKINAGTLTIRPPTFWEGTERENCSAINSAVSPTPFVEFTNTSTSTTIEDQGPPARDLLSMRLEAAETSTQGNSVIGHYNARAPNGHEQGAAGLAEGESDAQTQRHGDQLDELLSETKNQTFGVAQLLKLMSDVEFLKQTHYKVKILPQTQVELLPDADFPFGSDQITAWQSQDLNTMNQIAYYLTYEACYRLMRLHRDQEALDLFVDTLACSRRRRTDGRYLIELPMRLPARWRYRRLLLQLLAVSLNTEWWPVAHGLFEVASTYHGPEAALQLIQSQVYNMLSENRYEEASTALTMITKMTLGKDKAILEFVAQFSDEVMLAVLRQGQLRAAMKIFEWTAKQRFPNKSDRLEPIARACLEYCALPNETLDGRQESPEKHPIIWAISVTCGFPNVAVGIVRELVRANSEWVLSEDLVHACNAVLQRVWRETSNFQLALGLYTDLQQSALKHGSLPVSTYNCWLMICYKSGRGDEARRCLEDLQSNDGPGADIVSFAQIMHSQAMEGHWPAVEMMLARLHASGQMSSFSRECYYTFGDIFREFLRTFGILRGWDFITKVIEEFGMEPSVRLSNILLERCVWERQWSIPAAWSRWLVDHGFTFHFNALTVLRMMDCFLIRHRPQWRQFVRMVYLLRATRKGLVTTQLWRNITEAIAFDARKQIWPLDSTGSPDSSIWKSWVEGPLAVLEQRLQTLPSVWHVAADESGLSGVTAQGYCQQDQPDARLRHRFSSSVLDHKMILAVSLHKPAEAVEIFRHSLSSAGLQHSKSSLSIAVDASLRANEGYAGPAHDLLQEVAAAGVDITPASQHFLLQRLRTHRLDHSPPLLTQMVLDFYKSLAALGKHPKHHICVAAAKHLIVCGRPEGGIELLEMIFHSLYTERTPMDIVAMSIFVKGYARLGHLKGIKWVVDKVLSEGMRIDVMFCHELLEACKPVRELLEAPELSDDSTHQIQDALDQLNEWRAECLRRRDQQKIALLSDCEELVRVIQELSPGFESNEDVTDDLEFWENAELRARFAGAQDPLTEEAASDAHGPTRLKKVRPRLSERIV
ncbi:MAG: hypothetical protein M1822_007505 [Bathelium mastoideum]|nr:MAG: hypothetical protein M1822_007505 [Bathelium mastoideum]